MSSALTEEEHRARAMLLGMEYMPHYGWYRPLVKPNSLRIDAITLEVVSDDDRVQRGSRTWVSGDDWYNEKGELSQPDRRRHNYEDFK